MRLRSLVLLLGALCGCASTSQPQPRSVATPLRVGTSGDYAPFSLRDGASKLEGFDVELAEQLAAALGRPLQWVEFRWPTLREQVAQDEFDVAMSGVTWQPSRAVLGYMTRAVARGGPCVLGHSGATKIAVNRGGVLEAWARRRFGDRELIVVDENRRLPDLLASAAVGAIVTDSFELSAFARPGWQKQCEPALARKVYWVAPAQAAELGPEIDAWLASSTARVQAAQRRWFGQPQRLDALTHLVDLLARRLAFMPLVAELKARRGLPIEDLAREREVIDQVTRGAERRGLSGGPARALFELQMSLSKAVQRRMSEATELDLAQQIRPSLDQLGERILDALVDARASGALASIEPTELELCSPWLDANEREQLRLSLQALAAP